jgi:hypothetical protein
VVEGQTSWVNATAPVGIVGVLQAVPVVIDTTPAEVLVV